MAGGALLTRWSWQSVFLVNVPLVIIALAADALAIPETPRQHRVFDVTGAVLWTVAVVTVIATVIESSAWGWSSPRTALLAAAGTASAVLFTVHERRARAGVVDLSWFRDCRLTIACVVAAVLFFAMTGSSFSLDLPDTRDPAMSGFLAALVRETEPLGRSAPAVRVLNSQPVSQ